VIVGGNVIDVKDEHLMNDLAPMVVMAGGRLIEVKDPHP